MRHETPSPWLTVHRTNDDEVMICVNVENGPQNLLGVALAAVIDEPSVADDGEVVAKTDAAFEGGGRVVFEGVSPHHSAESPRDFCCAVGANAAFGSVAEVVVAVNVVVHLGDNEMINERVEFVANRASVGMFASPPVKPRRTDAGVWRFIVHGWNSRNWPAVTVETILTICLAWGSSFGHAVEVSTRIASFRLLGFCW